MLYEIMKYLNNFFPTDRWKEGAFTIESGTISLSPFVKDGQYFLIEGSTFNDGVYKYPATGLTNEQFEGYITVLAPPKAFISLCDQIAVYEANNKRGGYTSESFGGYSYTKATNAQGGQADWHDVYRERLNTWRKV